MNMNKKILILAASIIFHFSFVTGNDYTILSPDKSIKLLVEIGDKITYSVYYNGIVLPTHMAKMCDQRGGEFDLERLKVKTVLKKKPYLPFTFFSRYAH